MAKNTRFGLNCFDFGYTYNFEYITTFLVFFAAFVCTDKLTPRQKGIYYFMTVVAIGLNLKSQALVLTFMFVLLLFYFRKVFALVVFFFISLFSAELLLLCYGRHTVDKSTFLYCFG